MPGCELPNMFAAKEDGLWQKSLALESVAEVLVAKGTGDAALIAF